MNNYQISNKSKMRPNKSKIQKQILRILYNLEDDKLDLIMLIGWSGQLKALKSSYFLLVLDDFC